METSWSVIETRRSSARLDAVNDRTRRWDGDKKLKGVASGKAFVPHVTRLAGLMEESDWVAEDPHVHLLPHIERTIERIRSLEMVRAEPIPHGIYEVKLRWIPKDTDAGNLRSEVFAIVGSFAETSTSVEQKVVGDEIHFEVVTGMPAEETRFKTHGHLVRLRITGDAASDAARNHRDFMESEPEDAVTSSEDPAEDAEERAEPS